MQPLIAVTFFLLSAAAPPPQNDTVRVDFTVPSDWGSGFSGEIFLRNDASYPIWDWRLEFDFAADIGNIWNGAVLEHVGDHYVLGPVPANWEDGDLAPGEAVGIGFIGAPGGGPPIPATGLLNGSPITFNADSPAPPPLRPAPAPRWPTRVFAPYVDATAWPPFDYVGVAAAQRIRFYNLAFVVAAGANDCTPSWGGYYPVDSGYLLPEINGIRALGGDVMVSFGGAAGIELAAACPDVASLQAAYQRTIDAYGLTHVDFDIEGAWVADPPSIERRSQAVAGLQAAAAAAGRELRVWYTLPVLPSGLTADGVNVLDAALDFGVVLDGVNIMCMDYGDAAAPNPDHRMGEYAIDAAHSLVAQMRTLYAAHGTPKSDAELWRLVGMTPMIGLNDVVTETFYQEDAWQVLAFARQQDIGLLSFWSIGRDQQCPGGASGAVSPSCSSILQAPFEFTAIFRPFTRKSTIRPNGF